MPGLRLKLRGGVMKQIGSGGTWRSAFERFRKHQILNGKWPLFLHWLIWWRYALTEVWCHPVWNEESAILWPAFCMHSQLGRRPRRQKQPSSAQLTPLLRFKSKATANAKCTLAFCRSTVTQKGLYYGVLMYVAFQIDFIGMSLICFHVNSIITLYWDTRNWKYRPNRPLAGRVWPRHKKMPSSVVIAGVSRVWLQFRVYRSFDQTQVHRFPCNRAWLKTRW